MLGESWVLTVSGVSQRRGQGVGPLKRFIVAAVAVSLAGAASASCLSAATLTVHSILTAIVCGG